MKKLTSLLLSAALSAGLLCTSGTLPASAAEEPLILGVNAINVTGGEGHAVLYTPAHGESVKAGHRLRLVAHRDLRVQRRARGVRRCQRPR